MDVVADKQAITEVLYRYCRAMDRMDEPLARSVWHPEGSADYDEHFTGTGDGFVDWVWPVHTNVFATHSHQITNVLIEVDGDTAVSEAYVTVALQTKVDDSGRATEITTRGRYLDRWSRRDGVWAIDGRKYLTDVSSSAPITASPPGPGRRDRSDPSYELFR
jgi:hypothetical protein